MCAQGYIKARTVCGASWLLMCHAVCSGEVPLPAPLQASHSTMETMLYLDLRVNGMSAGHVVPVKQIGDALHVRVGDLQAAGVVTTALPDPGAQWLSLTATAGVEHRYDQNSLLLDITVPPHWLTGQHLEAARSDALRAISSTGLALNYAAHLADGDDRARLGSLWSEWRWFGGGGVLTHSGLHRYVDERDVLGLGGRRHSGYMRFDTSWTYSDEDQLQSWTVGDLVTSAHGWNVPVRIAGIKLSSDFRLRPDLITYPLPEFSGQATMPSTLDLFINGQRVRTEQLRPGPYTITSVPMVTGAGEATLVTTDMLGRQVSTTMPFYASSELLRAGLTDYAVSFGALRRDYGIENFSYGRFAASGSLRHGVTNAVTLEAHGELASMRSGSFGLFGLGTTMSIGTLGTVNGSVSSSVNTDMRGWQYTFGYRYANRGVNFAYQGARSTKHFYSLGTIDLGQQTAQANSDIVTAGISSARMGSLSIGYVRAQPLHEVAARFLTASYVRQLPGGLNLRIGASRDLEHKEDTISAQLLASFGHRGNLTVGAQQGEGASEYFRFSRSVPSEGGLGWNVGHVDAAQTRSRSDASLAWSGRYARAEAGVATNGEQSVQWADLRGSLLVAGNEVFAARQVSDAFVVVSTDGIGDVPVRYENQLIGRTNHRGRLLVPSVTSHYAGRFSIDPTDLPLDISVADTEQRLAVRRRSGALLKFDIRRTRSALIKLIDSQGAEIPVGSVAVVQGSNQARTVGYDGLVYFEDLETALTVRVEQPDGRVCSVAASLPESLTTVTHVGPLVCEAVP